jgi:hypothetical protein
MSSKEINSLRCLEGLTANDTWARSHMLVRVVPLQYSRGDSSVENLPSRILKTKKLTPWRNRTSMLQLLVFTFSS